MGHSFEGPDGSRLLIDALRSQALIANDVELARQFAEKILIKEVKPGIEVITQGSFDSDLYLILSGTVVVLVNGREVANRTAGSYVGEMSVIDLAAKRSATVKTIENCVFGIVTEIAFAELAGKYPVLWQRRISGAK